MRLKLILISSLALLLVASISVAAETLVLKDPVTDFSGTLSSPQQNELRATISAFEQKTGSQVAVLIVNSTKPDDIAPYANKVFNATKLGRSGVDDGVLLLVAKEDREVRIEVGRGLEGAIPDVTAWRIIKEEILPRFRQGNFFDGINVGVEKIISVASGEPLPPVNEQAGFPQEIVFICFLGIAVAQFFGIFFGKRTAALSSSIIVGLTSLLIASILVSFFSALIVYFFARIFLETQGSNLGGGRMHVFNGGSGGWSSSGGSSWSGGGGFSSGGGASGSW